MNTVNDDQAAAILLAGGVGVLPTDTLYGIVACAHDEHAVTRLYALKQRERKPGTIIAASVDQLIELGFDTAMLHAVARYWPAPLSVVVASSRVKPYLDQGVGDQAVRIPDDEQLRVLLRRTGPLLTSSANQPGEPPAKNITQACGYFKDTVDFYVDGGTRTDRPPSTIVRIATDGSMDILRAGAFKINPQASA